MSLIVLLCIICICIEVEHIILYNPIHKTLNRFIRWNRVIKVNNCFTQGAMLFTENSKEVVEILRHSCQEDEIDFFMINSIKPAIHYQNTIGFKITPRLYKDMINDIGGGRLIALMLQQVLEFAYLIITAVIACLLSFPAGLILFSMISILSFIEYRNNRMKNNKLWYLHIVNGFTCICMFLMIITIF